MSKEDLKVLNEALAEAVGFKKDKLSNWLYPHYDSHTYTEVPNFTSSMDSCIKWIYPFLHRPTEIGNIQGGWCCRTGKSGWLQSESMSEAFCLAAYKSLEVGK
jgi:hypothetical protein